jgi:hypothetical protein
MGELGDDHLSGGGARLSVSVYYRDSSVFKIEATRWHANGESELVPLDEARQAVYRSEADDFASLVMRARRGAPAR